MNEYEFKQTANDLIKFINNNKFNWNVKQNSKQDSLLKIWNIKTSDELINHLDRLNIQDDDRLYIMKRWFQYRVAKCDEYIFCMNDNIMANPNEYDKMWDFEINQKELGSVKFDLKSTTLPDHFEYCLLRPKDLIKWFYENQSFNCNRETEQNKLFLVHFSMIDKNRNDLVKAMFKKKIDIIKEYANDQHMFFTYNKKQSDILFIYENLNGDIKYNWYS